MAGSLASKVQPFGECFVTARPVWDWREGVQIDYGGLESKPFDALMFFTMYAHERPQADPRYKFAHRMAIMRSIGLQKITPEVNQRFQDQFKRKKDFASIMWQNFVECLKEDKTVPKETYTKGAVRLVLERLKSESQPNVVVWLRSKPLGDAYGTLSKLGGGIGPKIAALFLRDIWRFVGKWHSYDETDLFCIQPVDRWVERWAKRCWPPEESWPSNREEIAKLICKYCQRDGVDPVLFNMGAWLLGSHFQNLCSFFQVPMLKRFNYGGTLDIFDPNLVNRAIGNLARSEGNGDTFPI
jgi:hypothetical protein